MTALGRAKEGEMYFASSPGILRLFVVPIIAALALLAFGPRLVQADEGLPPLSMQFSLSWGTVTAEGTGFQAEMVGDSLHVTVATGSAAVQIDSQRVMELSSGDEVWLAGLFAGAIESIVVNVVSGQAVIEPTIKPLIVVSDEGSEVVAPAAKEDPLIVALGLPISLAVGAGEDNGE